MKMRSFIPTLLAVGIVASSAWASGMATPDEAKAMALKAAAYLRSVGPETALPAFSAKDGPWHDRDLYVIVQRDDGITVAHGNNPGLIGKSVVDLRDVDGKPFIRDMQAVADSGWVNFKWQNPVTHKVEPKTEFVVRVDNMVVGVGAYAQ